MENLNEKINHDLDYYKSGIKQLYQRSYQMYMFGVIAVLLLTVTGIGVSTAMIRGLLLLVFIGEVAVLVYLLRFLKEDAFEAYFKEVPEKLTAAFPAMQESAPQEDNQAYYFLDSQGELIKLNKKNIRNFPSKISQFTLLVGFNYDTDKVRFEQPLHFYYYDITSITHSDSYKKEVLKHTNFMAKRRKRRIRTLIFTLLGIALAGTVVYFGVKSYLTDTNATIFEKRVKEAAEEEINEQKTTIQSVAISRGDETIKLTIPKKLHDQAGYYMKIDNEKGYSYQSFISDTYFMDVSMIQKSAYASFTDYLKAAAQTREESSVNKSTEKVHEEFFIDEYREEAKEDSEQGKMIAYYFESEGNYGTVSLSIYDEDQLGLPAETTLEMLKSLKFERKENAI
ncbi:hypothetical protein [Enterococcus termitis]|uniref:Uncharacterized protein n=1 Tax=Enterococcus termitis TaxID=332950 RepID=A0A1E5GI87_9ENTE|nr:hypothetical protein [Enterococcus termitis]OEG12428.1 hypothetical protein BCR25_07770 [Enterococcus termitis]OJG98739.1 hypothetical protein RV18_GL002601 [Enterococcus termitis]